MSQWENEKKTNNGYIVRLYKREANIAKKEIIEDSMYMTWMNFDCMDVEGVCEFQDYHNSISLEAGMSNRVIYAARQKFFLYNLKNGEESDAAGLEEEELLLPSDGLEQYPLLTLTMLDIHKPSKKMDNSDRQGASQKELQEFLDDVCKANSNVKGKLYGTLSAYDFMLVLRGNDYRVLDSVIADCREKMYQENIRFNKTYTIAGLDLRYVDAWRAEGMEVAVHLSCTSDVTAGYLKENKVLESALKDLEVYPILGKYDFVIIGTIRSAESFVNLFLKDGPLSAHQFKIHKSNTRFLYSAENSVGATKNVLFIDDSGSDKKESDDSASDSDDNYDVLFNELCEAYSKITGLSSSLNEALSRLVLRAFQVIITTNHFRMSESLKTKLCCFLDFISINQKDMDRLRIAEDKIQDVYAGMINSFNLLLDNRISARISDFETPQKVLRYSGSSMKVLMSYSGFVDNLIKILEYNKNSMPGESRKLKYIAFVTAEPTTRISASVSLSYSRQYRFIVFNIPVDLMFETGNVLTWVTHEVGHFIRAGWNRRQRNDAYFSSVARGMMNRLMPYANPRFMENIDSFSEDGNSFMSSVREFPGESGRKFEEYRKDLRQSFQSIIYYYAKDYTHEFIIPQNAAAELLDDVDALTKGMQRIYEESIADMFMLQVLGVGELVDYLEIQAAYFKHINMDIANLPQENVSRIVAVSVSLAGLESAAYEEVEDYFLSSYEECKEAALKGLLGSLKEYKNYYMLEPLAKFLSENVKKGLQELLATEALKDCWEQIKKSYANLKKGNFGEYLQFVLSFNEE